MAMLKGVKREQRNTCQAKENSTGKGPGAKKPIRSGNCNSERKQKPRATVDSQEREVAWGRAVASPTLP